MNDDSGMLNGIFTIEKYKAGVAGELQALQDTNAELLARMKYQRVLAAHAKSATESQQHHSNAEELWQEVQLKTEEFATAHAEEISVFHNGLLNGGITLMWQLITGASSVHFDNTNSRLVVGTSSTAFNATQTGVQSSLATLTMDASYPTVSAQSATWRSTAGTASANGSWQEFCITNNTTAMNRAVSNQGTKTSSDIWVPSLTISLS